MRNFYFCGRVLHFCIDVELFFKAISACTVYRSYSKEHYKKNNDAKCSSVKLKAVDVEKNHYTYFEKKWSALPWKQKKITWLTRSSKPAPSKCGSNNDLWSQVKAYIFFYLIYKNENTSDIYDSSDVLVNENFRTNIPNSIIKNKTFNIFYDWKFFFFQEQSSYIRKYHPSILSELKIWLQLPSLFR